MPVPKPKAGESQDDYIPRCISFVTKEEKKKPKEDRRPAKQIQAICFETWRDSKKESSHFSTPIPIIRSFEADGKRYLYGYVGFWEIPDDFGTVLTPEIVDSSWKRLQRFPAVRFMHRTPFGQLVFNETVKGVSTKIDKHGFHVLVQTYAECEREWNMVKDGGWGFSYGLFPAPDGIQKKCFDSGKCYDAFVKGVLYEVSVVDTPANISAVAHVLRALNGNHTGETVLQKLEREKKENNLEKDEIEQLLKEREERFMEDVKKLISGKKTDDSVEASVKAMEERLQAFITEEVAKLTPVKDPTELERTFEGVNNEIKALDDKIVALRKIVSDTKAQGESSEALVNRIAELEKTRTELADSVTASVETTVKKQLKGLTDRLANIENLPDFHSPATINTGQPVQRALGFGAMLEAAYRRNE